VPTNGPSAGDRPRGRGAVPFAEISRTDAHRDTLSLPSALRRHEETQQISKEVNPKFQHGDLSAGVQRSRLSAYNHHQSKLVRAAPHKLQVSRSDSRLFVGFNSLHAGAHHGSHRVTLNPILVKAYVQLMLSLLQAHCNSPPDAAEFTVRSLEQSWPTTEWAQLNVLAAVSGGADSVALLRLMVAARDRFVDEAHAAQPAKTPVIGQIVVAHFDHGMRPDSADDADWVESMAGSFGLTFHRAQARGKEPTSEQAAREARYAFLTQVAEAVGARYVVTGHTFDDQAETILHRVIRGTGLAGLAGIPRTRVLTPAVTLMRPLLDFRRAELRALLDTMGQDYRDDPTNAQPIFTRNRLRHDLMPHIAQHYNPEVASALVRLGQLARSAQDEIEIAAEALFEQFVSVDPQGVVAVETSRLNASSRHLVRELLVTIWKKQSWSLQQMTFEKWDALAEQATSQSTRGVTMELPGAIRVRRSPGRLVLQQLG